MATKTKNKTSSKRATRQEVDTAYFLKLVLYLILGSFWLRIEWADGQIPIPVGLLIGLFLVSRERFQIDRKIEYAFLLMAMFIGFWLPIGISFSI